MKNLGIFVASVLAAASLTGVVAQKQEEVTPPKLRVVTVQGCFSSPGELIFNTTFTFNSKSACAQDTCFANGYPVAGTSQGDQCWCGHKYPPKADLVKPEECNVGCSGYDIDACGGIETWTIYNTGRTVAVESVGDPPKDKTTSTDDSPTPAKTAPQQTVVITEAPVEKGTNVGAIAGGVVVGVLAVSGIVAGMWFYLRRKRNREIEEEHRRNAAVNSFMGGKPGSSAGSITDARLDPVMAQRRLSDGSIADNQDYSRKILRVTNA